MFVELLAKILFFFFVFIYVLCAAIDIMNLTDQVQEVAKNIDIMSDEEIMALINENHPCLKSPSVESMMTLSSTLSPVGNAESSWPSNASYNNETIVPPTRPPTRLEVDPSPSQIVMTKAKQDALLYNQQLRIAESQYQLDFYENRIPDHKLRKNPSCHNDEQPEQPSNSNSRNKPHQPSKDKDPQKNRLSKSARRRNRKHRAIAEHAKNKSKNPKNDDRKYSTLIQHCTIHVKL